MGRRSMLRYRPGWTLCRNAGVVVALGAMLGATAAAKPAMPARAAAGTAFVRVNQLGYATGSQAKRAYLMTSGTENEATFSVKDSLAATVYTAAIRTSLSKCSSRHPTVH